jgi:hypothetical protein
MSAAIPLATLAAAVSFASWVVQRFGRIPSLLLT